MATPTLSRHTLPGGLGPILIDVRAPAQSGPRPAILVLHGFKGFKDYAMFPPFADRLARAGFTAVTFNASGSGVDHFGELVWPERFGHNTFSLEIADLLAVATALDSGALGVPRPTSVGVVGHSRGGGTAILAADRIPRIAAVVTWAGISTVRRFPADEIERWRRTGRTPIVNPRTGQTLPLYIDALEDVERNGAELDILAAAAGFTIPWLVLHGTKDETVPFEEAVALARVAPPETARLVPIEGAGHGFGAVHPFAGFTPELDRVFDESTAWLAHHLP